MPSHIETSLPARLREHADYNLETLAANSYSGRGLVQGFNLEGTLGYQVYWLMGRSEGSKNRELIREKDKVKTRAFDPSIVKGDPNLLIYTAMDMTSEGVCIASNGDQTDTIRYGLHYGRSFPDALSTRTYEPDDPNFTPRISGILVANGDKSHISTSQIIRDPQNSENTLRQFRSLDVKEAPGIGLASHTYYGDSKPDDPLFPLLVKPYPVPLEGGIDDIAQTYWNALNPDKRVALAVREVDLQTKSTNYRIINQLVH